MFMKIFSDTSTCFTLVNISQKLFIQLTKKLLVKWMTDENKGIQINKFVGLKSKM